MTSSKLNDKLQIFTSIGVLIGPFVVAYELNQARRIATAESSQAFFLAWLDVSSLEIESELGQLVIKPYEQPDELTADDVYKLNSWMIMVMSMYASVEPLLDLGIADNNVNAMDDVYAEYLFGSRYARDWFERNKSWLGDRNVEIISHAIETTPVATKWKRLDEYYSQP